MITRNTDYSIQSLRGLSTDTKPVNVPNGSEFREMDTGKKFLFSAAGMEWIEQPCCGGGSGGGGSVEPLVVHVIVENGVTQLDQTSSTIYDAYLAGTPIIFYDGNAKQMNHPSLFMIQVEPPLDDFYFTLASMEFVGGTPIYRTFTGSGNSNPVTTNSAE